MRHIQYGETDWTQKALQLLCDVGIAVVEGVLDPDSTRRFREKCFSAWERMLAELPAETRAEIAQLGHREVRLPFLYEADFYDLLEHPALLAMIDGMISPRAVVRFMTAYLHRAGVPDELLPTRQFHTNFPRRMRGAGIPFEATFLLDPLQSDNSTLRVVYGSHHREERPPESYLDWAATDVLAPAGCLLLTDSALWHHEGHHTAADDRCYLALQLVPPFFKSHFDFTKAVGADSLADRPERTRQLLGWNTRIPDSLEAFYVPAEQRLYKPGQF